MNPVTAAPNVAVKVNGDALVGSSIFTVMGTGSGPVAVLDWWQGGLVLLGFAILAAAIGYLTSWRRDVT